MPAADHYLTVRSPVRASELKVAGSRFIADICPVRTKDEAESYLFNLRKEFYDATHHCYAYRLGFLGNEIRAADDGEPAGTAGRPILTVLEGAELTNVLCVVTRYFGGTKLGTGGLVRAYTDAAKLAVQAADVQTIYRTSELRLTYSFDDMSGIERLVASYECRKIDTTYSDTVEMHIAIRNSFVDDFLREATELFSGRIGVRRI